MSTPPQRRGLLVAVVLTVVAPILLGLAALAAGAADASRLVAQEARIERAAASSDGAIAALLDDEITASARAARFDAVATIAGVVAATSAVAVAALGIVLVLSRRSRAGHDALDPLTALLDESGLRRRLPVRLADRRFRHHLVAVVRISGFDLAGEVYGHEQADRVQVDVSRRLRSATSWLVADRPDAVSDLARIGDGEFAVSVHADSGIDHHLVERVLTLHSGRVLRLGDDRIPVTYEIGRRAVSSIAAIDESLAAARRDAATLPVEDERRPAVAAPVPLARPA